MRFPVSFPGLIVFILLLALITTACSGSDDTSALLDSTENGTS